ncbi:class I SAM-dependent methyltransferase [Streptomyces sp. A7024]|uniref:Class I SAM-dependent methyltransferase n=1 Tax=Streptomyces coryli TaxID=1128680 RepID=A0A6G4TUZ8_9ACTN|nr:class I SAM-dependent methyltransferase [Streptomyces coryli]NGN63360.1 class I SAM-dependent methyltransferase [Streptomyces coryli]
MTTAKRAISRALYGSRYDRVPWPQRIFVRPGERLARELQWQARVRRAPVVPLADYEAGIKAKSIEEFISCHLCGESRQQPLFEPTALKDNGKKKWSYRVVRCPDCGFLYRNPNIKPERLGELYANNYSTFLTGKYAARRRRRYRLTMDAFDPVFADGRDRRLLDFGCGAGYFLQEAEQRGFDACGVDLSPDSVDQANERLETARAYHGDPEDIPEIADGGFDVLTLWSVLAHLPRPLDDFRRFRELLAPGGVLLILTVNAKSLQLKAYGSNWIGFTKNHLMFYSSETLPHLLRQTGFAGVSFEPSYGDSIEAGTARIPEKLRSRLRRTVASSDGGMMMRALAFADEKAIERWGQGRDVVRLTSESALAQP